MKRNKFILCISSILLLTTSCFNKDFIDSSIESNSIEDSSFTFDSVNSEKSSSNNDTLSEELSDDSSDTFSESLSSISEEINHKTHYFVPIGTENQNLEVTYFQLENSNSKIQCGDATYIKIGDIDIIIDAGEKRIGSDIVVPFLKEHVKDSRIELVITTHTDSDHIGGMVGLSGKESVLSINDFTYDTIIDCGFIPGTIVVEDYYKLVETLVEKGANYYTYYDMILNDDVPSNFYLGKDASLNLLDTKFYEQYMNLSLEEMKKKNSNSTFKNNCSVPFLLTHGSNTFLFAGDCESSTEKALVDYNNLPEIDVFKANHHGSETSNTNYLLDVILPKNVIIESTKTNQYNLPSKVILDRLKEYTLNVYTPFINGNIYVTSNMKELNFTCEGFYDYATNTITPGSEQIQSIYETDYYVNS